MSPEEHTTNWKHFPLSRQLYDMLFEMLERIFVHAQLSALFQEKNVAKIKNSPSGVITSKTVYISESNSKNPKQKTSTKK